MNEKKITVIIVTSKKKNKSLKLIGFTYTFSFKIWDKVTKRKKKIFIVQILLFL